MPITTSTVVKLNHQGLVELASELISMLGDTIEVKKMHYRLNYLFINFRQIHGTPDWDIEVDITEILDKYEGLYGITYKLVFDHTKCGPGSTLSINFP